MMTISLRIVMISKAVMMVMIRWHDWCYDSRIDAKVGGSRQLKDDLAIASCPAYDILVA